MSDGRRIKATVVSLTKKKGMSWGIADLRTVYHLILASLFPHLAHAHSISPSAVGQPRSSCSGSR